MKRLFLFLFLIPWLCLADTNPYIIGQSVSSGGCGTEITDDFSSDTIANYTQDVGSWSIGSGALSVTGTGSIRHNTQTSNIKQWVKVDLANEYEKEIGVILRATGSTGYKYVILFKQGNGLTWYVYNGSSWDQDVESDSTITWQYTETVGVTVEGTGNDTIIKIWQSPSGSTPCDWGTADITLSNNPTNAADTGLYAGMFALGGAQTLSFDDLTIGVW